LALADETLPLAKMLVAGVVDAGGGEAGGLAGGGVGDAGGGGDAGAGDVGAVVVVVGDGSAGMPLAVVLPHWV
jgi:hypothetical protein